MKTLLVNIGDNVNANDFSARIKELYPSLQIAAVPVSESSGKKFSGVGDLKPLYVENFRMYRREELYDR